MFAPVDRDVELLLATPQRPQRRRLQRVVSDTPNKGAPPAKARRVTRDTKDVPASSSTKVVAAPPVFDAAETTALLVKLFDGLESVLILLASRRTHPTIAVVREHVGSMTTRELTDERLQQVLAAAGDMLEATWVGNAVELVQRIDGEARRPTNVEKAQRQQSFCARLAAAVQHATAKRIALPRQPLPPRPTDAKAPEIAAVACTAAQVEVKSGCSPAGEPARANAAAGESRLDALRARIQARQASERIRKAHRAKVGELEHRSVVSEDALAVHGILVQLFARGEGDDSAASEAEVVAGICSSGFSMQSRRTIDAEAARTALALLIAKACGWFVAHTPQHSQRTGLILRRMPDGASEDSVVELQALVRSLQEEKRALLAMSPEAWAATQRGRKMRLIRKTTVDF